MKDWESTKKCVLSRSFVQWRFSGSLGTLWCDLKIETKRYGSCGSYEEEKKQFKSFILRMLVEPHWYLDIMHVCHSCLANHSIISLFWQSLIFVFNIPLYFNFCRGLVLETLCEPMHMCKRTYNWFFFYSNTVFVYIM